MTSTVQTELLSASQLYGVPYALLVSLANVESGGNQSARGSSGEVGVMQLMPATAAGLGVDPYDEWQNIQGGARFLRQLYDQLGSWNLAVAGYNAGGGCVANVVQGRNCSSRWPYPTIPTITQAYVPKVLGVPFDPSGANEGPLVNGDSSLYVDTTPPGGLPSGLPNAPYSPVVPSPSQGASQDLSPSTVVLAALGIILLGALVMD